MLNGRAKILFVCSRNKRRSLTAETIFKSETRWEVRSAGTEESALIKATPRTPWLGRCDCGDGKTTQGTVATKIPRRIGGETVHLLFYFG
jgi:Low molecular weight phosphotyrosine protein phosphatase